MSLQNIEERRKARKKGSAEDFTPLPLVNEILNKLSTESCNVVWEESKTYLDPAVGNGNFLIEILKRKLKAQHNPLKALSTLYGTDIMLDNINECRLRLIKVLATYSKLTEQDKIDAIRIVAQNIVCTPLDKYPNGSLDYDFSFDKILSEERAKKTLQKIREKKLLDQVKIT